MLTTLTCDYCPAAQDDVRRRRLPDGDWVPLCADCWADVQVAERRGN